MNSVTSAELPLAPVETPEQRAAVARLYGEPLLKLPADLYIPPEALEVFLDAFEGPLDLLLYLIRKANIDVLDIPMAALTAQYLEYVEAMRRHNLELAADYLLIAAMLLEIKSRMLLPKSPRAIEEEEDPRAELVRRLLDYEQMKLAAAKLDAIPRVGRDLEWVGIFVAEKVVERLPEVGLHDLQLAWLRIARQAKLTQHHHIRKESLSVREHMSRILRCLQGGDFVVFESLFDPKEGAPHLVVSFLAVLELVKERLVQITQTAGFSPIYVKLNDAGTEHA
ncbi:segregation and condensation protein A [Denitromonas iodatirespirans]|uniref:Segregation and condensation protein A n=1 Tax=Denitromonas iodatirespirans TaxID=2795389 RepID=A0A944H7U4_DENI1|nr:ScpA family protein [Denitromonas iodatirespirans]MBT0960670.1 segregation/condensation protein A [Denitromonas iodatirespirans]